jgi:dinuclear metal center YbgI/SA1388 family protein
MQVSELVAAMEELAPIRFAESWDNVGLLVGDPAQPVSKVLLTIDYTAAVAAELQQERCDAVIAYHPPIFAALKRIVADTQPLIFNAIRQGIAIYSPHTALDVADGGTNDMLADAVGMTAQRKPLRVIEPKLMQYKLVTFVPEKDVDKVSEALFAVGAGRIGQYSSCSFRVPGTGTFFGEAGTNPAVGQPGSLQQAAEIRLETVLPITRVEAAIRALRQSHPYEEPAFDLVQLAAPPEGRGMGRIGELSAPTPREDVLNRIKEQLGVNHLLVAGPTGGTVTRAAVCAGACGDVLDDALAQHADLYLTGEMRHHDAIRAAAAGMTVVCTLHSNSERAVLNRLAARLAHRLPGLSVCVSRADHDPFAVR